MTIEILTFSLGPLENNTYLVVDPAAKQAAVIDPTFNIQPVLDAMSARSWNLSAVWITHAHFDHIAGVSLVCDQSKPAPQIALHPADLPLWRAGGGARYFGFQLPALPDPTLSLAHGGRLTLGQFTFEVRHTPGHSPGHVVFFQPDAKIAFCGDVIFFHSVGRTDLHGANSEHLANSIRTQIYSLPPETRLLSGHGPETTVGDEMLANPFVRP